MLRPGHLADVRVEVVVPALAALLAGAPGQLRSDAAPLLRANLSHQLGHPGIILGRPRTFRAAVEDLGPAVKALHVRLALNVFGHLLCWDVSQLGWVGLGSVLCRAKTCRASRAHHPWVGTEGGHNRQLYARAIHTWNDGKCFEAMVPCIPAVTLYQYYNCKK